MAMKDWSTTAADNATADTINWAEGQNPNTVNNSARQLMADVREWYEDVTWTDLGDTPTYNTSTTFLISGDVTATYHVGRWVKLTGTTPFTSYAVITASSYSSPNTTVTIRDYTGTYDSTVSTVSLHIVAFDNAHHTAHKSFVRTITADETLTAADHGQVVNVDATSAAVDVTVDPTIGDGYTLSFRAEDVTNAVTVTPSSGTIGGASVFTLFDVNDVVTIKSDGTNFIVVEDSARMSNGWARYAHLDTTAAVGSETVWKVASWADVRSKAVSNSFRLKNLHGSSNVHYVVHITDVSAGTISVLEGALAAGASVDSGVLADRDTFTVSMRLNFNNTMHMEGMMLSGNMTAFSRWTGNRE